MDQIQKSPEVILNGDDSTAFLIRQCKVSETIELDATATHSLNGEKLSFRWHQNKEIGSVLFIVSSARSDSSLTVAIRGSQLSYARHGSHSSLDNHHARYYRSSNQRSCGTRRGRVYHLILEVASEGKYPLTRFRRVLLDVRP